MNNENTRNDPNVTNSYIGDNDQAPADPSNTSNIGQKVEQDVIDIKEGISEQSNEWEDKAERTIPQKSVVSDKVENYLKNPSPEEMNYTENKK